MTSKFDPRKELREIAKLGYKKVRIHATIQDGEMSAEEKQLQREAAISAIDNADTRDEYIRSVLKWVNLIAERAVSGGL